MRLTSQRKHHRSSRLDELVLNARTARWLGRHLWRPTVLMVADRAARPIRHGRR